MDSRGTFRLESAAVFRRTIDWWEIDPRYFRPSEVDELRGEMSKARRQLGWEPKVKFKELVRMMVEADLEELERNGDRQGDRARG